MTETDVTLAAALMAGPVDASRLVKLFRHADPSRLPGILRVMPDTDRAAWQAVMVAGGHLPAEDATGTP